MSGEKKFKIICGIRQEVERELNNLNDSKTIKIISHVVNRTTHTVIVHVGPLPNVD